MKSRTLLTSAVVSLTWFMATTPAMPQAACDPERQLRVYLEERQQSATDVLAFDHQTQLWTAYRWEDRQLARIGTPAFEPSFTNKPRLLVAEGTQPLVLIINTNPLLFSTVFTGATEAPIEDLANLQQLTALLGGFLSTTVAGLRPEFEESPPAETPVPLDVQMRAASVELEGFVTEPASEIDPILRDNGRTIIDGIQDSATAIRRALAELQSPRSELEAQLRRVNEANAEIKSYLQLIESHGATEVEPRRFDDLEAIQAGMENSFGRIDRGRATLRNTIPICQEPLTALRDAIRLFRAPLPEKPPEKKIAIDQFLSALDSIGAELDCPTVLTRPIQAIKSRLLALHANGAGPPSDAGAAPAQDRALRPLVESLNAYLTLVARRSEAIKAADDLMAKRGDAAKVAGAVQRTIDLRDRRLLRRDPCSLIAGVLEVPRPGAGQTELKWSQIRSETFKVVADSPYKDVVTINHPIEVTAGYDLKRTGRWSFDVDVATIYTEIADPVFVAVDDDDPNTTTKVIGQTDEKGRAGELGLFVSFQRRFGGKGDQFSFGPQIGAGFDTDHPSVFAGFGLGISRYAKLGFGLTAQQIKELRKAKIGDPVAKTEDITTRDVFDYNYYVSLSITLDELPFFKAPEE